MLQLEKNQANLDLILSTIEDRERAMEERDPVIASGFPFPQESPIAWVKYTHSFMDLDKEAITQSYIHENVHLSGVAVPREFLPQDLGSCVDNQTQAQQNLSWRILVMDYVNGLTLKEMMS
ncbi:unnamed protein product [Clonostachys rosea]|uniref:Uncharacterized protein n=1 Tax=Bionectria ochroleuca TaxID=29856 RepID=A0ABY6UNW0_BIOOC|nr:unnamed protein product [Clonostachys rosea]